MSGVETVDVGTAPAPFWRDNRVTLERLPTGRSRIVHPPRPAPALADPETALRAALAQPLDHDPLAARLHPGMKLTITCSDLQRPTPSLRAPDVRQRIVEAVLELAAAAGVDDVEIVVARGLHRRLSDGELRQLLGRRVVDSFQPLDALHHHDATADDLAPVGHGFAVNRRAAESDLVVSVDVHDATASGWRAVAQGLGDYSQIRAGELAGIGSLPVFRVEAVVDHAVFSAPLDALTSPATTARQRVRRALAQRLLTAATVAPIGPAGGDLLRSPARLTAVFAGDPAAVGAAAGAATREQRRVEVDGTTDVVTLGVPCFAVPGNRPDPLAALAAGITTVFGRSGAPLVRDGGVVVLTHPLRRRFDSVHHPASADFYDQVLPASGEAPERLADAERRFVADEWYRHLYRNAAAFHPATPFVSWDSITTPVAAHQVTVIVVGADPEVARRLGATPASTLDDAFEIAVAAVGATPSITHLATPPALVAAVR